MYSIYQVQLSEAVYDHVNSDVGGHSATAKVFPEYNTHMETMHKGSEGFTGNMFIHYSKVCEVAESADGNMGLEEVFKILNGYYTDEDTGTDDTFDAFVSGFTMRSGTTRKGEPYTVRNMHSLSVGDIVYNSTDDTYNMVDGCGFADITVEMLQEMSA